MRQSYPVSIAHSTGEEKRYWTMPAPSLFIVIYGPNGLDINEGRTWSLLRQVTYHLSDPCAVWLLLDNLFRAACSVGDDYAKSDGDEYLGGLFAACHPAIMSPA